MKFKTLNTIKAWVLFATTFVFTTAHAGLISETWTFEVTDVRGDYLTKKVGETLSLTFDFDDASETADFESGNKIMKFCSGSARGGDGCTDTSDDVLMIDNINLDSFWHLFDLAEMENDGFNFYDKQSYAQYRRQSEAHTAGEEIIKIDTDKVSFTAIQLVTLPSSSFFSDISFYYRDGVNQRYQSAYDVSFISRIATPIKSIETVPEPSTFAILSLALLAFTVRRLKQV